MILVVADTNTDTKTLNNSRGIFVVPILSLIFEKLQKIELHHVSNKKSSRGSER